MRYPSLFILILCPFCTKLKIQQMFMKLAADYGSW